MISVSHLTKKFGSFVAVDDISFSVNPGEIFAFLGPNGAGKTTTIKMLTTVLSPTSGEMELNGVNPAHDKNSARHSFGIVFQDPSLDDELSAYENMEFHARLYGVPAKERAPRIKRLLELVDLYDRRKDYVRTFSGGMKRRLEIARGFLHHPKILFLDEPTLGLDPATRKHIWDYVRELNQKEGLTVFFTTHHMEEVEKAAHRIAIIDHGHIIATGTLDELRAQTGKATLEEAFLALTGSTIRDESASAMDSFRQAASVWGRKR